MSRERELVEAFVHMADTLVEDYDVNDLLQSLVDHSVTLLDAEAAGLLLADQRGGLRLVASSTDQARLLELFQLQNNEGPCLDCYHTGEPVPVADLAAVTDRWPQFAPEAQRCGYRALQAVPLRLRGTTIGAMNLFHSQVGVLSDDDSHVAQGLADVATIGILQERLSRHHETLSEQLQAALNSRVVIEQAKGILAARGDLDMDTSFTRLRSYARDNNLRLAALARDIVDEPLHAARVLDASARPG